MQSADKAWSPWQRSVPRQQQCPVGDGLLPHTVVLGEEEAGLEGTEVIQGCFQRALFEERFLNWCDDAPCT